MVPVPCAFLSTFVTAGGGGGGGLLGKSAWAVGALPALEACAWLGCGGSMTAVWRLCRRQFLQAPLTDSHSRSTHPSPSWLLFLHLCWPESVGARRGVGHESRGDGNITTCGRKTMMHPVWVFPIRIKGGWREERLREPAWELVRLP